MKKMSNLPNPATNNMTSKREGNLNIFDRIFIFQRRLFSDTQDEKSYTAPSIVILEDQSKLYENESYLCNLDQMIMINPNTGQDHSIRTMIISQITHQSFSRNDINIFFRAHFRQP